MTRELLDGFLLFFWGGKVPVFENRVYGIHGYYSFLCVFKVSFFGFIGYDYDRYKLTILPISLIALF